MASGARLARAAAHRIKQAGEGDNNGRGEPRPVFGTYGPEKVGLLLRYWGTAARKLSNTTVPGAFGSDCQVPAFISSIIPVSGMAEFQASL